MENSLVLANPTNGPQTDFTTFSLNDHPYLIENWKLILAQQATKLGSTSALIRVKDEVANLCIRDELLVRTPLAIPDGFYKLTPHNELVRCRPADQSWANYTDPDIMMPDFNRLTVTEAIPKKAIAELKNWVQAMRDSEPTYRGRCTIAIDDLAFLRKSDPSNFFQIQSSTQGLAVRLPVLGNPAEPLLVKAAHLQLALIDMLRYDAVNIACENRPGQDNPLFFFGKKSWDACALVMPTPY